MTDSSDESKLPKNYGSLQKPGRASTRVICQFSIEIDTRTLVFDTTDHPPITLNRLFSRVGLTGLFPARIQEERGSLSHNNPL